MYLDGAINQVDGFPDQTLRVLAARGAGLHPVHRLVRGHPGLRPARRGRRGGLARAHPRRRPHAHRGRADRMAPQELRRPQRPRTGRRAVAGLRRRGRQGAERGRLRLRRRRPRQRPDLGHPGVLAMTCADDRGFRSYAELRDFRRQAERISPHFGAVAFDGLGCTGWPEPVANPSRRAAHARSAAVPGAGQHVGATSRGPRASPDDPGIGDRQVRRPRPRPVPLRASGARSGTRPPTSPT